MTVQDRARAAERRANLLAGLNDAPTALIGWDLVDRPLPAAPPRPEPPLRRFAAAMNGIADALAGFFLPRLPLADPTQGDVVKGA